MPELGHRRAQPLKSAYWVLILFLGLSGAVWSQSQPVSESDPIRERELSRNRLLSVLDSVFGHSGYRADITFDEAGAKVLLVVDRRFRGEYGETELQKLVSAALEDELTAPGAFVLTSLPISENQSIQSPARDGSLIPFVLGGLFLFCLGALLTWLFSSRKAGRNRYRDQLDADLDNFRKLAVDDAARVAQVLRMWMRPAAAASAESGGMTQRELAAVLLLSLPKDSAALVIQHFLPKEVQILGDIMVRIARVRRTVLRYAVSQFFNDVQEATGFGVRSEWDMHGLFETALGEKRSRQISGFSDLQSSAPLLENLRWLDVDATADLIRKEHPQLQAIVIAALEVDKATQVLECLPESARADVLMRVAELDKLQPAAVEAVSSLIEKKLGAPSRASYTGRPGQRQAASILKSVSAQWAESLMQDTNPRSCWYSHPQQPKLSAPLTPAST